MKKHVCKDCGIETDVPMANRWFKDGNGNDYCAPCGEKRQAGLSQADPLNNPDPPYRESSRDRRTLLKILGICNEDQAPNCPPPEDRLRRIEFLTNQALEHAS